MSQTASIASRKVTRAAGFPTSGSKFISSDPASGTSNPRTHRHAVQARLVRGANRSLFCGRSSPSGPSSDPVDMSVGKSVDKVNRQRIRDDNRGGENEKERRRTRMLEIKWDLRD